MLLTLLSVVVLAGLGFYDDYAKIIQAQQRRRESLHQAVGAGGAGPVHRVYLVARAFDQQVDYRNHGALLQASGSDRRRDAIGVVLTMLTIVGSSNAVNLTDGLDGLAIGCTLIVTFVFVVLTYAGGQRPRSRLICKFRMCPARAN